MSVTSHASCGFPALFIFKLKNVPRGVEKGFLSSLTKRKTEIRTGSLERFQSYPPSWKCFHLVRADSVPHLGSTRASLSTISLRFQPVSRTSASSVRHSHPASCRNTSREHACPYTVPFPAEGLLGSWNVLAVCRALPHGKHVPTLTPDRLSSSVEIQLRKEKDERSKLRIRGMLHSKSVPPSFLYIL